MSISADCHAAQHGLLDPPSQEPVPGLDGAPQQIGRRLKILLVEDHADSARALSRLLTMAGYEVQSTDGVRAGVSAILQTQFDIVLTDLGLPDGCGADLIRQLRARSRAVPCIALSGYGLQEDVQRSLDAGFAAHLVKPVTFNQICAAISSVMH
jgi:DNA-binding response OmpR family regulator